MAKLFGQLAGSLLVPGSEFADYFLPRRPGGALCDFWARHDACFTPRRACLCPILTISDCRRRQQAY